MLIVNVYTRSTVHFTCLFSQKQMIRLFVFAFIDNNNIVSFNYKIYCRVRVCDSWYEWASDDIFGFHLLWRTPHVHLFSTEFIKNTKSKRNGRMKKKSSTCQPIIKGNPSRVCIHVWTGSKYSVVADQCR